MKNYKHFNLDFVNNIEEKHSLQADIRSTICLLQTYSVDLGKDNNDIDETKRDVKTTIEGLLNKL